MQSATHTERKNPQLSISRLADYMAASEQAKRTIIQSCKYRAIARVIQHVEARTAIAAHLLSGDKEYGPLTERADSLRNRLADSSFEYDLNEHNADYIDRFIEAAESLIIPAASVSSGQEYSGWDMNGVKITFRSDLSLQKTTRTNKVKIGALMLRYAKGKPVSSKVAEYHSSLIFGRLIETSEGDAAEPEKQLCGIIDAYSGAFHPAPGNAGYLFKEAKAACLAIAERWPAIKRPKGAVLATDE